MILSGKRIVVIGGSSGIGLAIAAMAVEQGSEVVIASRSQEKLDEAKAKIEGIAETRVLDARHESHVAEFFRNIGEFDHLATPGAATVGGQFLNTDVSSARGDFDSKFWSQYCAVKYGAPNIRPGGSIVLFSGVYSQRPPVGAASIAAVNGAIESLSRALTVELSPIRVNVISPGLIDTPAYDWMPEDQRVALFQQVAASLPAKRAGSPEDIAQAVLFLMADQFAAGTILFVDGGFTMR